jgi:hypothetical protein
MTARFVVVLLSLALPAAACASQPRGPNGEIPPLASPDPVTGMHCPHGSFEAGPRCFDTLERACASLACGPCMHANSDPVGVKCVSDGAAAPVLP